MKYCELVLLWIATIGLSLFAVRPINKLKVHCECDWAPKGSRYEGKWMEPIEVHARHHKIVNALLTAFIFMILPLMVAVIWWFTTMLKLHYRSCLIHQLKRVEAI